ncbi:MAG: hydroxymethylbilane synthase, partial [Rhodocyclaceae bacterium]
GSCEVPLGAFAEFADGMLRLRALVATPDGSRIARAEASGPAADPEGLGRAVVEALRAQGADDILAALGG